MKIETIVEKLAAYSSVHLMAEEADELYIKNRLSDAIGLAHFKSNGVSFDEIDEMESCGELIEALVDYALKAGEVSESNRAEFRAEIYRTIGLTPSAINETFFDLYDLKPSKAFEWFEDYSVKAGGLKKFQTKPIGVDAATDVTVCPYDYEHFQITLNYQSDYDTQYWLPSDPFLPGQAFFAQQDNPYIADIVRNGVEFTGNNVMIASNRKVALCMDYELPITKAPVMEAIEVMGVPAQRLDFSGGPIKLNKIDDKAVALIEKLIQLKPEGTQVALLALRDGSVIVKIYEGCLLAANGLRFFDSEMDKVFRLCVKYLTGGAIYNNGNLSEEYKPYEEMIKYIVEKGKAGDDAYTEAVKRGAAYKVETGGAAKDYLSEIIKQL